MLHKQRTRSQILPGRAWGHGQARTRPAAPLPAALPHRRVSPFSSRENRRRHLLHAHCSLIQNLKKQQATKTKTPQVYNEPLLIAAQEGAASVIPISMRKRSTLKTDENISFSGVSGSSSWMLIVARASAHYCKRK